MYRDRATNYRFDYIFDKVQIQAWVDYRKDRNEDNAGKELGMIHISVLI